MADVVDGYELAPMQQGMLFDALSAPGLGIDVEQVVVTLAEPLDVEAFERAFRAVIQRHPVLRTRFRWADVEEARQEVLARAEAETTVADWTDLAADAAERRFDEYVRADRRRDFDLSRAPLTRLFVAALPDGQSRVLWTYHHILGDGRSLIVLLEWFTLYDAARRGETASLPPSRPYREYVEWRRSLDLASAEAFWRRTLATFTSPTPLGVEPPRARNVRDVPFDAREQRLSRTVSEQLRDAARHAEVTVNTMVQAAWAVLLHRYSGQSDVVFGATRAGRWTDSADDGVRVGLFINTLPMRVEVDDDAETARWLAALRAQQTALRPYQHTSLAAVHGWSGVARPAPLFESIVIYDHHSIDALLRMPGRHFDYIGQTAFPLALRAYGDDEMLVRLEYSTARFSDAAIARMLGHLVNLLERLAGGAATHVRDLDPVTAEERAELVGAEAIPEITHADRTLHAGFARQVAATPEAIAVSVDTDAGRLDLSYAELNRRADAVAARLRTLGVTANEAVGLRVERGADVVIGILAILKAGGAYLPLDPVYPTERVAYVLEDAGARVVLTQRALAAELAALPQQLVSLDQPLPDEAPIPLADRDTGDQLAYVMYTSGSTGKPKGVPITHRNVLRLFAATERWFDVGPTDVWTLFHSYSFDISVWEIWGALLTGGRLVVVTQDTSCDPAALHDLLMRERVTMLCQTPTAFRALIDADRAGPPAALALRSIIFVGEALEPHILKPWIDRYGDVTPRLINMYGPTETTVYAAYRPITRADLGAGSVIGVPIPDLHLYVLDADCRPVPIGVPGELYIAGAGVSCGYLNRPDLTAERFLPNPFHGGTMYRSGDLTRRLDDGDLEYLGRIDQQVKIRGFRIEPGEIEAVIAEHPAIRQVAVIGREDIPGDKRLVAYLVGDARAVTLLDDLRETLRARLPEYMVPAHFQHVEALPRTPNGKLDRAALPAPDHHRAEPRRRVDPRSASEELVVAVFNEALDRRDVGVFDNFFDLGGHSLMAARVVAKLCEAGRVDLPLRNLFERPTPERLALAIDALSWAAADMTPLSVSSGGEREEFEL
jgi:amino acid adenylation domain-containing protein